MEPKTSGSGDLELVVLVGLQGAGKTTFYRSSLAPTHALVSKDLMSHHRRREDRQRRLVEEALRDGRSVAVDNTNPAPEDREELIRVGHDCGARVVAYWFDCEMSECMARNAARTGRARVPEIAFRVTFARLKKPSFDEGFDRIFRVVLRPGDDPVVTEETRPDPVGAAPPEPATPA